MKTAIIPLIAIWIIGVLICAVIEEIAYARRNRHNRNGDTEK